MWKQAYQERKRTEIWNSSKAKVSRNQEIITRRQAANKQTKLSPYIKGEKQFSKSFTKDSKKTRGTATKRK
jgi:hypothetical protein